MPKCQFTTIYQDEIGKEVDFSCQELPLVSGHCIFHDKDYLQDKTNNEHKRAVLDRLKRKVNHAIANNEALFCIGFQLPDFRLSDLSIISKEFTKPVYFFGSQFIGKADFTKANFEGGADFSEANFQIDADFHKANFQVKAEFNITNFQGITDFERAQFLRGVSFSKANFQGEAFFYGVKLQGRADFIKAEFNNKAYFSGAKFFDAYFYGARYSDKAEFLKSQFKDRANFSDATFYKEADFSETKFNNKAYFFKVRYFSEANFFKAEFSNNVHFSGAKFSTEVNFSGHFNGKTKFNYVLFEGKEKVTFDIDNLSNVSFMNTDITGVRFSDKARWGGKKVAEDRFWGGKKVAEDRFKVVDETLLEERIKGSDGNTKDVNLGSIKAVYRSLRENYEYRMTYDEAGQFFIREMELKRKYREVPSSKGEENSLEIKQNNWFRRNLFSLTGWYYHLSRYGESIWRPTLAGLVIVFLSTLFWLMQENPELGPSLPIFQSDDATNNVTSKFVGLDKFGEGTHWLKASERSIADFIPLLPLGSNIKVGIIHYVIKIVGGAVTFGLIAIALRRRFERRYRH